MARLLNPGPRQERRLATRYKVKMDCRLHVGDRSLTAVLEDISLGGAGIRLPNVVSSYCSFEGLRFQIVDVGFLRSRMRWKNDRRAGIQFEPTAHRSAGLNALIARLEQEGAALPAPEWDQALSREITTVTSGFLPTSS